MKKYLVILATAIFAGVILFPRFYHLDSQPQGLHIDEVSFAADAKAIAESGRDTWGARWPLIFKAYGEWKAPGLVYSMAFWTKILGGMNSFVARLPSAIAGLTILLMLGLTLRRIYPKAPLLPIYFSVFVLAFSPWHFDMSRIFYEAFSALGLFSISLYFLTSSVVSPKHQLRNLLLGAVFAGLSGYFYASIRYVAILVVGLSALLQDSSWLPKLKSLSLVLLTLLVVGLGWVGDLVSDKGLTRLSYYRAKTEQGSTLQIDEKRQYCYLSMDRDASKTKACYYLWNKPVNQLTGIFHTYGTYLGSDYLFFSATSEYGFDSEYGAFLFPLLPLYLTGLFSVLRGVISYLGALLSRSSERNPFNQLSVLLVATALISLLPAGIASNVNMRMGLISLYIIAIIIGIGLVISVTWVAKHLKRMAWVIYLFFTLFLSFYIVQSLTHYFHVFTRSNDMMWTSDAEAVFGYVKSVSPQYDSIIDAELHGPLAPYFYGDLTTAQVQQGSHSTPDDFGFTYLTKAGKYELRHVNVLDLACEKLGRGDMRKMLVITSPVPALSNISKFSGRSWSGALLLREVYDVDDIIAHQSKYNTSFYGTCGPK